MSNTIGYSLGCGTPVRYNITQREDVTDNIVTPLVLGCSSGCLNADYRERRYWAQIPISATATSGTDYYGALAPSLKFQGGGTYRDICPTVCYCEGPIEEGATVTKYLERYETRWMALLEEGRIYYGRVDGALIQAPLDLFPDPLPDTATHIALSFDANARPVFAYEDDGTIYVRRYVAGAPTTYSWTGTEPCLFFNGVINFDDTQTDVVCYHLTASGGGLYARFQRENFGVANLVLEDSGLYSLMAVDRGRGVLSSHMVVELSGKRVFASVYPPWPVLVDDFQAGAVRFSDDGSYTLGVVEAPPPADTVASHVEFIEDGLYFPITFTQPGADGAAVPVAFLSDGAYTLVIVSAGTTVEPVGAAIAFNTDGAHTLAIVSGGSYSEGQTATVAFNSDGDYSP